MIFLQLWWTLMVLSGSNTLAPKSENPLDSHDKLRNFHHAVNEARGSLHELHSNYGNVEDSELYRHRRNSIDELLASFAETDDKEAVQEEDEKKLQKAADDWFRDFQARVVRVVPPAAPLPAAKHTRAAGRAHGKSYANDYGKMLEQTEIGKVKKKYKTYQMEPMQAMPETSENKQPEEPMTGGATQLDIKLKHVQQLLANQEMEQQNREYNRAHKENKHFREKENKLPEFGDNTVPDGVYEQTLARLQIAHMNPNNLSHEANYKLSKIEQEAAERAGKVRYPSGLQKRSSSAGFNPMNEIKLKTSNRLMRKGMGPSLPSNALSDNIRAHYVDDMLMRRERNMKRERERQKLQQEEAEEEKESMLVPYKELSSGFNSVSSSSRSGTASGSSLELPNMNNFESPQSYDYRLPQFDQLHTLSQRTLPNVRDFVNQKGDRFKRQHQKLKETEAKLQQKDAKLESDAKAEKEEQPQLVAKKEEAAAEEIKTDAKVAIVPQVKPETELKTDKQQQTATEESKAQQTQDQQPVKLQAVKEKEKAKLKREEAKSAACQTHSDAVVKLLANKISQHTSMERDKRNIKRWAWHRLQRQKANHAALEAPHQKRRSRRSVELQTEEAVRTAAKMLDDLEDHNGKGLLNLDEGEDVSNLKDNLLDSNTYANSRFEVPMMHQRNNNMAYPQQQQQMYMQQQQPMQQQPLLLQCQPQLPLQPQQQQQLQQTSNSNNLKSNFNLTHFFNELAKLQKLPAAQLQQLQQQPQQQQQPPGYLQPTVQLQPSMSQQQQCPVNNQCKPGCAVRRYLSPLMKKLEKVTVTIDPCIKTTRSSNWTTTMNPDCISILATATAATTTATAATTTATTATTAATTTPTPTTATAATTTATSGDPCASPDAVKLKISVNGNLCSDPKTKQLFGNGSITVQPNNQRVNAEAYYELVDSLVDEADIDMDNEIRYTRQANRSTNGDKDAEKDTDKDADKDADNDKQCDKEEEKKRHRLKGKQRAKESKKSNQEEKKKKKQSKKQRKQQNNTSTGRYLDRSDPVSDSYDKLMTGTASREIVRAVFDMVSNDPSLDPLLSVLSRNRNLAYKEPKPFYQIRNDRNEDHLQQTEEMVRKTMESISDIIDQQMRQRACIPLRPDLVEFYDIILKTMAEQQKTREKREAKLTPLSDNYNQDLHILDANNIEQKSRIVKKLLRQYDELPVEEQRKAASVRDELLMDLIYLRKMADSLERSQRNAQLQGVLKKSSSNEAADQQLFSEYSPRFIKLLKTAEIFKEVGEQRAKEFIGI